MIMRVSTARLGRLGVVDEEYGMCGNARECISQRLANDGVARSLYLCVRQKFTASYVVWPTHEDEDKEVMLTKAQADNTGQWTTTNTAVLVQYWGHFSIRKTH